MEKYLYIHMKKKNLHGVKNKPQKGKPCHKLSLKRKMDTMFI